MKVCYKSEQLLSVTYCACLVIFKIIKKKKLEIYHASFFLVRATVKTLCNILFTSKRQFYVNTVYEVLVNCFNLECYFTMSICFYTYIIYLILSL